MARVRNSNPRLARFSSIGARRTGRHIGEWLNSPWGLHRAQTPIVITRCAATQIARAHIFGGPFGGDVGSGSAGFDVGVEGSSTRSHFVMRVPLPFSFSVRVFQHSEQMSYSLSPICRFEHSLHWSHRSQTIMALPLSGHLREQWAISRTDPITGNPTFALRFRSTSLVTIQLTVARSTSK
jgi:hypothetical protein